MNAARLVGLWAGLAVAEWIIGTTRGWQTTLLWEDFVLLLGLGVLGALLGRAGDR